MTRIPPPALAVGLVVATALALTACYLPAAPNVTPTPSQQQLIEQGMTQVGAEAAQYSATLTAMAQSPLPTPTPQPTLPPTAPPTAQPTTPFIPTPTQPVGPQPTPTPSSPPPGGETTYVVQRGDNLFRIALRYGLRVADLAAYNNIVNPNYIFVGQVIRIPGGGTSPTPTPPRQGEILYTVQPGDNLFRIALRYNLNYIYLASYNGIANPHHIYVGQVVRIPAAQ